MAVVPKQGGMGGYIPPIISLYTPQQFEYGLHLHPLHNLTLVYI